MKRSRLAPSLLFLILSAGLYAGYIVVCQSFLVQEREAEANTVKSVAQSLAGRLTVEINADLYLLNGLLATISIRPDLTDEEFQHYASRALENRNRLINIALARDYVIRHVYPVEGNESVLGLDYRTLPDQLAAVERVRRSNKIVIAGPIDLVQGGKGLVGRVPIIVNSAFSQNGQNEVWGFASAVTDFELLLQDVGIPELDPGLNIAIRGKDGLGAMGEIFYGDPAMFSKESEALFFDVELPNGSWQLAACPKFGWAKEPSNILSLRFAFFGAFLVLLMLFVFYFYEYRNSARLNLALSRAEIANRAKSEFLAKMSHDLRTPLNAIIGFSGLIQEVSTKPERSASIMDYAKLIEDSGEMLLITINNLIDTASIERGDIKPHIYKFNMEDCLKRVVGQCQQIAKSKHNDIQVEVSGDFSEIYSDEAMIQRIFLNLISNATKFSNSRTPIKVTLSKSSDGNAIFRVEDQGIGMSPDVLDQITEAFYQVEKVYSRKHEGAGLGLSIVKSFADLLGANLTFQSTEGEGTTATVSFPSAIFQSPQN